MKNILPATFSLLLLFNYSNSAAQKKSPVREPDTNRLSLFKSLPSKINCEINDLESLLESPIGKKVSIRIASDFQFKGIVSSLSSQLDKTVKSVVVRSNNMEAGTLTFSKVTRDDGSTYFTGRIISFQHADVYEITYGKGQYAFVKKGFYDLINE